jgi:hypothetical protein
MDHGRKAQDCIDQDAWNALSSKFSMFVDKVPHFDLLMYSIHLDHGVHSIFTGMATVSHHKPLPPSQSLISIALIDKRSFMHPPAPFFSFPWQELVFNVVGIAPLLSKWTVAQCHATRIDIQLG